MFHVEQYHPVIVVQIFTPFFISSKKNIFCYVSRGTVTYYCYQSKILFLFLFPRKDCILLCFTWNNTIQLLCPNFYSFFYFFKKIYFVMFHVERW